MNQPRSDSGHADEFVLQEQLKRFSTGNQGLAAYSDVKSFFLTTICPMAGSQEYLDAVCRTSYMHPNGWAKIVLIPANRRTEFEFRIHAYERRDIEDCSIHNHAWSFNSMLVAGRLRHQIFDLSEGSTHISRATHPVASADAGSSLQYYQEENVEVGFKLVFEHSLHAGQPFRIDSSVFHRVAAIEPGTISMVVQEPFERPGALVAYPRGLQPPARPSGLARLDREFVASVMQQVTGYCRA